MRVFLLNGVLTESTDLVQKEEINFDPELEIAFIFSQFFFPIHLQGIKAILSNNDTFPDNLWYKLNNQKCNPLQLDDLCDDLYGLVDEYDFAIIMLALREGIRIQDESFLSKMEMTLSYSPSEEIKIRLIEDDMAKYDQDSKLKIIIHC